MPDRSTNPTKDRVAIAAAATTGYAAVNTARSALSYAADASISAIRAAGLTAADVDGLIGSAELGVKAEDLQQAIGLPKVTYFANAPMPSGNHLAAAVAAVHSGFCDVLLVCHASYRLPWNTGSAWKDPLRRIAQGSQSRWSKDVSALTNRPADIESVAGPAYYAAWAARYLHQFSAERDTLGLIAINARTNALSNPWAAKREPLSMNDYLAARMVRAPLGLLDMDLAVDGGDAFVVTSAERGRDLALPPVLIHGISMGMTAPHNVTHLDESELSAQHLAVETLRNRSDFWINDVDVFLPYDGFSILAVNWLESVGYCKEGEAGDFLRQHWDAAAGRILIDGRIPVNPHGGSLAEGASQGFGHLREAVHQIQGNTGTRQVPGAQTALLTPGGFFFNPQCVTLRADT